MEILRKIFGPSNSLVLAYDHIVDEKLVHVESQLEETGRYYRYAKLAELAAGRRRGLAAVCFSSARKSLFLRLLPYLRAHDIPVTVFVDPECVGLNRLPQAEELHWYRDQYPERFPPAKYDALVARAWEEPAEVEAFLVGFRRELGPLPLDRMDPTLFFTTWGKILEISPALLDVGVTLTSRPKKAGELRDIAHFVRQQTRVVPSTAWNPHAPEGAEILAEAGLVGAVGPRTGAVVKSTPAMELPRWDFGG